MRGKHHSIPLEDLIKEAEFLAKSGAKEIVLIAQDTTDYGKDLYDKPSLALLLNKLSEIEGIEWIRLMYAYPSNFPDDVVNVIASNPKVCKYLDIPLQHISDDVLRSMRRGVTSGRTRNLIKKLREQIPDLTIRTTFIVGYPNESEKDFDKLCRFVEEVEFDRIGVFTFSVEENTSSFILGDPVTEEEKERRKGVLMNMQKEISLKKNASYVGKKLKVLAESVEGDFYIARSYRDAPEVDGEILIPIKNKKIKIGKFYTAEITGYEEYDLYGKVVS